MNIEIKYFISIKWISSAGQTPAAKPAQDRHLMEIKYFISIFTYTWFGPKYFISIFTYTWFGPKYSIVCYDLKSITYNLKKKFFTFAHCNIFRFLSGSSRFPSFLSPTKLRSRSSMKRSVSAALLATSACAFACFDFPSPAKNWDILYSTEILEKIGFAVFFPQKGLFTSFPWETWNEYLL